MKHQKFALISFLMALFIIVIALSNASAIIPKSNESLQTKANIETAKTCFNGMISRNISINRANESLQEALQLYSAQSALEEQGRVANYKRVNEQLSVVCQVKELAFKADDELKVFLDSYNEINKTTDLSLFEEDYKKILTSFKEERFEDTSSLINEGYTKLSEIQSQQTTFRLFYETTSKTLKNFMLNNWKKISITLIIIFVLLLIFWRAIRMAWINSRIRYLHVQREAINSLIKNLQKNYFGQGKISELEYKTKLKRYKELTLDIERQIPLLREELAKLGGSVISPKKKKSKSP